MTRIGLYDRLLFRRRTDQQIRLFSVASPTPATHPPPDIPLDQRNLIWQAIDEFRNETSSEFGVDVGIDKRIPIGSGLGGGSGNAAAALVAANRLSGIGLSRQRLIEMAGRLGSDVAFFLGSAAARCTSRGERTEPLPASAGHWMVLGMPPQGLGTADVYAACQVPPQPVSSDRFREAFLSGRTSRIARTLHNRLQQAAIRLNPWIARMQQEFSIPGCLGHQLTGSGAAWFGMFSSRGQARRGWHRLSARMPDCRFYCVATCRRTQAFVTRHRFNRE